MKWTSIFSPAGVQVRDDHGRDVPLFNWHAATTSVKDDPQLAGIQARLQTIGTGGFFQKMTQTQKTAFAAMFLLQVLAIILLPRFGVPPWPLPAILVIGSGWLLARGQRFEFRRETVALLLAHERCASCGYPLSTAHADDQRCVKCAECGSAWLLQRIGTNKTPNAIADMAPARKARAQVVDGRLMALDARDRFVPIKTFADLQSIPAGTRLGECASTVRRALLWAMVRDIVVLTLVVGGLLVLFSTQLGLPAWGWNPATWTWVGLACLTLFAMVRWLIWSVGSLTGSSARCARAIVKTMVRHGFCPSCAAEIHPSIRDRAGNLACTQCNAAWPSRETDL